MSISRYQIFLKAAETGSVSRTAEAMGYTQSGISHVIRGLEEELGIQLFIRRRNGVELTANGQRILPYVRNVLREEENLRSFTYDMNNKVEGTLRIGSFSSVTESWLPDMVLYFREHYPLVKLEIMDGNYDEIRSWIRQGIADVGFLSSIAAQGLRFVPLYRDPLCVIFPPGHPLEALEEVTLAEVIRYPLIMEAPGCDNDIKQLLESFGQTPDSEFYFRDDGEIAAFVEKGVGISISQELVQKSMPGKLVMRYFSPPVSRSIGIGSLPAWNSLLGTVFLAEMRRYLDKTP
ncbi:LysR family transcriptional regulator [Lachnoclostridium sp. Marseille-P6806]|uniref:LysR family transcriptional regulator n=1 Tax=Lachnoclostridium sp. Marseille-P6806 TaxID=2364793 RepID=UPI0010306751|nr:LysR family transcriptional regulator [Lachnoclostridium sp. Marseille-P6806]